MTIMKSGLFNLKFILTEKKTKEKDYFIPQNPTIRENDLRQAKFSVRDFVDKTIILM